MNTKIQHTLVVTYEHSIISDSSYQFENDIAQCQSEVSDKWVIRHVTNLKTTSKYKNILAYTYDTDVLMPLISSFHLFSSTSIDLVCQFGFGVNKKYYCIKTIASSLGQNKCKALPFSMHFQDVIQFLVSMGTAKPRYGIHGSKVVIWNKSLKYLQN